MNPPSCAAPNTAAFDIANPHALATILEASQTKSIIACRDIFDLQGIKLWARDQPVSAALQRKLMDRKLRNPLETCLTAEDGVTVQTLTNAMWQLLGSSSPLTPLLRPCAPRLMQEVTQLPLHPVAQLLLTACQASRPASFEHAVQAMALAGALMIEQGGGTADVRVAMLGGLLHDLGEIYIDPRYGEADADRMLDLVSYQQLVVHPHVGKLLLSQLTNYPATLARAVGEHHERLDGSGYPLAATREAISPLGRMLAVVEATLGVVRGEQPSLARASVALRVVPGEFDLRFVGGLVEAARHEPPLPDGHAPETLKLRLARLDGGLLAAQTCADALSASAESATLKAALALASHLLTRLRTGWTASGLWCTEGIAGQDVPELDAVERELSFRLRAIERAALLRAGELDGADAKRLALLGDSLRSATPLG
ncbi:MAG TPA: HD domain-containing phosphohydrolase [Rubrivivax sp.]|nr:HD domain-containing protein [Burkholderiales bacterium]HNT39340.1 HD domain-containing phosphohydrolase [Rubrivivax sp.]